MASIPSVEFSRKVPTQTEIKAAAPLIKMVMDKYTGDLRELFGVQRKVKKIRDSFNADKYGINSDKLTIYNKQEFIFIHDNIRKLIKILIDNPDNCISFTLTFYNDRTDETNIDGNNLLDYANITKEEQKVINEISKQFIEYKKLITRVEHLQSTLSSCSI